MVDLDTFLLDLRRARRTLLLGGALTVVATLWTLVVPVVAGAGLSVVTGGSALFPAAPVFPGLPASVMTLGVALGSLIVSTPLALLLLSGSVVWHLRVRQAVRRVGLPRPAVGILAPARLTAVPVLIGFGLSGLSLPILWWWPGAAVGDWVGAGLGVLGALVPLLAPVLGLWIGLLRGVDSGAGRAFRSGTLTAADLGGPVRAFPLVARRPRAVARAELLRREGDLDDADALLRAYLERIGVGPSQALVVWARVHRDRGDLAAAEACAAAASWLVPVDLRALRLVAGIRHLRGRPADARRVEAEIDLVRATTFGLALGARDDGDRGSRPASASP